MEQLIDKLLEMGMGQFMDHSRQDLIMTDEVYLKDIEDEGELEQRYMRLDLPDKFICEIRKLVQKASQPKVCPNLHTMPHTNDYIACVKTCDNRYSDISYMAGIKDAVRMFVYLGLLKDYDSLRTYIYILDFLHYNCQLFLIYNNCQFSTIQKRYIWKKKTIFCTFFRHKFQ